jgi:hypothetical protein
MGLRSLMNGMLIAGFIALGAAAQTASPVQIIEALPAELGGFVHFGQITDFEARPGGAGLGASRQFREPETGAVGTIYVYARGRKDLAEGAGTPAVEQEVTIAGQEIERAGPSRNYTIAARSRAADLPGGGKPSALRCDAYVISFASGNTTDSFACVGVRQGRFLKLRVSVPRRPGTEPASLLARFGHATLAALPSR